jgi:hypothetical protein
MGIKDSDVKLPIIASSGVLLMSQRKRPSTRGIEPRNEASLSRVPFLDLRVADKL